MFPEQIKRFVIQSNCKRAGVEGLGSDMKTFKSTEKDASAHSTIPVNSSSTKNEKKIATAPASSAKPINMEAYQAYYNTNESEG